MRVLLFTTFFIILFKLDGYSQEKDTLQTEQILQIRYDRVSGGKYGMDQHLIITKDSILYNSNMPYYHVSAKAHIPNSPSMWLELIRLINIKEFDNIKNGESLIKSDGEDEYICIQTPNKNHKEINGNFEYSIKPFHERILIVLQYVESCL